MFNTVSTTRSDHRFCVAPMMNWSDRHCRYLWRLISKKARLYTEMVTTGALLQGSPQRWLQFNEAEHPVALQLGGSNPKELAIATKMACDWGYDEVNLNCGCPSARVQNGMIGACLMAHPRLVSDCIKAMLDASSIPISIKHRIGIDTMDDYQDLENFVATVAEAGCQTFIIHARKAWLQGLSPKQNREVPPLAYDRVHRLKQSMPELTIVINGGIRSLADCTQQLTSVDGVMIGREAYNDPYLLAGVDQQIYGIAAKLKTQQDILLDYAEYCRGELAKGCRLHHLSKHVLGLFQGQPGARAYRRHISEGVTAAGADTHLFIQAMRKIL